VTLDPDCVSARIDNSAASANSRLCKIMPAVKSVLNCGRERESDGESERDTQTQGGRREREELLLSESAVQTCCSVESEPSASDSYP